mgnify:CR=1 FL=1
MTNYEWFLLNEDFCKKLFNLSRNNEKQQQFKNNFATFKLFFYSNWKETKNDRINQIGKIRERTLMF